MRYWITFKPPNNPWECIIYRDAEEQPVDKKLPLTTRKALSTYSLSLKIAEDIKRASLELVRIEEVPQD